jgi:thiol-disulfide isomerase/thioredoxin
MPRVASPRPARRASWISRLPRALAALALPAALASTTLGCSADEAAPLAPRLAGSKLASRLHAHACAAGDEPGAACSMPELGASPRVGADTGAAAKADGHLEGRGRAPGAAGGPKGAAVGAAREPGMPRLLELEMPGCTACAKMAPVVKSVEARCSSSEGAARAPLVEHVDVTLEEGEALAKRHGVKSLPTFLALDAEGDEVMRLVGLQEPEALATLVAEVTGRACCASATPC